MGTSSLLLFDSQVPQQYPQSFYTSHPVVLCFIPCSPSLRYLLHDDMTRIHAWLRLVPYLYLYLYRSDCIGKVRLFDTGQKAKGNLR